ncbi:oligosaccharide flippase family protein [Lysinibacillus fusiformis]|uniref:oligosaccharide flippase family protein n=1 Tax=Lysinibacillus fusiformis TaxID=28031 RepID=UPI0036E92821
MKKILIKDGMILFLGTAINMLIMLVMQVILARNLNLVEYGAVVSSFNFINFLALFISFGASEFILKSFGQYGHAGYRIVQTWIKLIPISLVLLAGAMFITYFSGILGELTNIFLLIIIPNILLQGLLPLTLTVYQIEANYKKIVVINLVLYMTRLVAAIVSLFFENSVYCIGYILSGLSILGILYYYSHIRRYFKMNINIPAGEYRSLDEHNLYKKIIKGVLPYALLAFFYYGFYQSNIIFINIFLSETAVGLYNAAFTIINLTFIIPTIVLSQLFNPRLHFWIKNDINKVIYLFMKGSRWMLVLGVAISALLFPFSHLLIQLLFGTKFSEAAIILMLLLIIIPIRYIQAVSDAIMNTENQIHIKVQIFFIVFVVNLVLNIILIPKMGLNGVVLTTILSETILFLLTFTFCRKFIRNKRLGDN